MQLWYYQSKFDLKNLAWRKYSLSFGGILRVIEFVMMKIRIIFLRAKGTSAFS
jgi:hypothetical protein